MAQIVINCEPGVFEVKSSGATLIGKRQYVLACEAGSFSLTGKDVNIARNRGNTPNPNQPVRSRHSARR